MTTFELLVFKQTEEGFDTRITGKSKEEKSKQKRQLEELVNHSKAPRLQKMAQRA